MVHSLASQCGAMSCTSGSSVSVRRTPGRFCVGRSGGRKEEPGQGRPGAEDGQPDLFGLGLLQLTSTGTALAATLLGLAGFLLAVSQAMLRMFLDPAVR